nr:DUF4358 domain-containing protein [uncultured Oscillibacter sp.]
MKKRLLALLLALAMTAMLAACGGKQAPVEGETPGEDIEAAEPEEDGAEDAPEADADSGDPEPETGSGAADPARKPEAAPVQKPAELPADSQSKPADGVDLAAFYETLSAGEDWPAMTRAEGEVLDAFYPGLSGIATDQCAVYTAMISATVGEIALVEARSADDVQKVKDIFQARVDYQVGDDENPGGAWYPQTIEGWKNGSRIVSNGNFVMLVALSDGADGVVAAFDALFA